MGKGTQNTVKTVVFKDTSTCLEDFKRHYSWDNSSQDGMTCTTIDGGNPAPVEILTLQL